MQVNGGTAHQAIIIPRRSASAKEFRMKVFEGFTVVELADRRNQMIGKIMAESGARVVQIEPIAGSPSRWTGPFVNDQRDPDRCLDYWWYNAGKESVALDITRKPGQEIARQLIAKADIFIESTHPGALCEYGLDYESVADSNPGLIYLSFTDFGQDGPWVDQHVQVNDHAHLALGGPMGSSGYSDLHETPIGAQRNHAYSMSSVMALHTLTGALFERLTSEEGQYIDIAIHECVAVSTESAVPNWLWYNEPLLRQTGQHARASYGPATQVQCADGKYVQVSTPALNNNAWTQLVKWMDEVGVAGGLSDARYHDDFYRHTQLRHSNEIFEGIHRLLAKVPAHEAFLRGQAMGLAWTVVRAPEENLEFAHYRERGYWQPVEHEEIGKTILYPRGIYSSPDFDARPPRRAPHLGEHTRAILADDLGVDSADVEAYVQTGVVR